MPTITDRITTHQLWATQQTLRSTLDELLALDSLPPDTVEPITRADTVARFVASKLAALDPLLVPLQPLNDLNNQINSANNELRSYLTNKNPGHLTNTTTYLDAALVATAQLLPITSSNEAEALREAVTSIRRAAGQHLRYLDEELKPLTATIANLTTRAAQVENELSTTRQQLTNLTAGFQEQFSQAQELRRTEHTNKIKELTDANATEQQRLSETVDDLITKLDDEHAGLTAKQTARAQTYEQELTAAFQQATATITKTTQATVATIEDQRMQAERLLGVIGDTAVTSGYQKTANEARILARVWQVLTVLAMGFLIWIAYNAFLPIVKGTFSWEGFAGRVFVTLTVGVLAAYCARQGDKQSETERANRRLELELQSIGPYLLPLSPERQEELRALIAERTFGHHQLAASEPSPASVIDLLLKSKEFQELLTTVVKATK